MIMTAKIYLVISGKGGVGKTTVFANLATSLAMVGKKIAIMDTDLAMANLGLVFGLNKLPVTLHEVLAGEGSIENAMYEGPHNIKIIPSGDTIEGFQKADPSGLVDVIEFLKERFDYLFIDSSMGINEDLMLLLPLADHIIIIATPDLTSMADALRMKIIAQSLNDNIDGVILNCAESLNGNNSKKKLEQIMDLNVLEVIPYDSNVRTSLIQQTPLVICLPDSPASVAIKNLATRITGIEYPGNNNKSGIFNKVLGKLGIL